MLRAPSCLPKRVVPRGTLPGVGDALQASGQEDGHPWRRRRARVWGGARRGRRRSRRRGGAARRRDRRGRCAVDCGRAHLVIAVGATRADQEQQQPNQDCLAKGKVAGLFLRLLVTDKPTAQRTWIVHGWARATPARVAGIRAPARGCARLVVPQAAAARSPPLPARSSGIATTRWWALSTHRAVVELVTASRDVPALLCAGATWIDRPAVVEFAAAAPAIAARRGGAVPVVARAWPATRATVIPAAGRSPAGLVVRARMSRAAALGGPSRRPVVFPAPLTWGPAAFPRLVVPAGTAHHSPPFTLYVAHGNSFRPSLTAHRHHPTRRLTDRSTWRECTILCLPVHPFGPAE